MATYTDQQVFRAFMAGANRGLEEWDKRKRTNSRSRNAVLSKLTRKWRHHIWDNIVAGRPYWEQPNRKKQAAVSEPLTEKCNQEVGNGH